MTPAKINSLIQAVEQADTKAALVVAVRQLAQAQSQAAVPVLIRVLGYNNPGAAAAAVDGLVKLGDAVVPTLLDQLDGYNYGARAWAIRAVSDIAHPDGLPILLDALQSDFALSVRRAAACGIGKLRWHLLSEAQRRPNQQQSLSALLGALNDAEWVVRYAAVVGLQSLARTTPDDWQPQLVAPLQTTAMDDSSAAVRARAIWAIEELLP